MSKFKNGDRVRIIGQSENAARNWIGTEAVVSGIGRDFVDITLEESAMVGVPGGTYQWSEHNLELVASTTDLLTLLSKIYRAQDAGDITQEDARACIKTLVQVL